jgi:hypothetical protein
MQGQAFEGTNTKRGYFRPQADCIMFSRDTVPLCVPAGDRIDWIFIAADDSWPREVLCRPERARLAETRRPARHFVLRCGLPVRRTG